MSSRDAWNGEPRVIYHDVLDRIESLKASRAADDANNANDNNDGGNSSSINNNNKRFVSFMFDLPGPYSETRHRLPELSVIDAKGKERRRWYHGRDLGPLDVGSVIVLSYKKVATPIAAYFVGEEENQVLLLCVRLRLPAGDLVCTRRR